MDEKEVDAKIGEVLDELTDLIRETKEYKNYAIQRDKLRQMPDLKRQIDEFRKENYRMQVMSSPEELFDKAYDFEQRYAAFRDNPIVEDFLAAELALCRLLQRVNTEITAGVDFE
ncbi:MAG: YlbF family regulator [Lachnospiraceae bacterium]|nr:YlbF family regulator [Lachnospiraceae bacterium]